MEDMRAELVLLMVVLSVLFRADALALVYMKRKKVDVVPAVILSFFSPILSMMAVSYATGRGSGEEREGHGWIEGSVVMIITFLLSQLFAGMIFSGLLFLLDEEIPSGRVMGPLSAPVHFFPIYVLAVVSLAGVLTLFSLKVALPSKDLWGMLRGERSFTTSLFALLLLPLLIGLSYPITWLLEEADVPGSVGFSMGPSGDLDVIFLVIGLVIIVPFVEEMVFRGYLFKMIDDRLGAPAAIALTSLLFAVMHLNPLNFVPILLMGVVMGALRMRTGSIVPSLVLHSANNLASILLLYVF